MSCGIVKQEEVRSIPIREAVPWKDSDKVMLKGIRHDDQLYWAIVYYPHDGTVGPVFHSAWVSRTPAQSYWRINGGESKANPSFESV
jgi:hypothetical protein